MLAIQKPESKWSSIPLDHPAIIKALALIPPEHHANTWIAGSAATRFGQHKDVDVWVTNLPPGTNLLTVIPEGIRPTPVLTEDDEEYVNFCYKAYDLDGLQIMVGGNDIYETIGNFDISCHAGAKHILTGQEICGVNYSERVTLVNYGIASKSLARLFRFAERYHDWSGLRSDMTLKCAKEVFQLYALDDIREMSSYLKMDKGL